MRGVKKRDKRGDSKKGRGKRGEEKERRKGGVREEKT